jgi:acyl-coenzyme A synthetase/AMP-(fatty) acid ligase
MSLERAHDAPRDLLTYPLLAEHDARALVAFGDAGKRSATDLVRATLAIASHLPRPSAGSHVLVACGDRYAFAACLLGAWAAGHAVALPPNLQPQTIDGMRRLPAVSLSVHDTDALGGPDVLDVRPLLVAEAPDLDHAPAGGSAPSRRLPPIPAEQYLLTLFTSGSTGAPRGCPKSAAQLLGEAQMHAQGACRGARRVVSTVPPFHIYGMLFGVLVPLMGGAAFLRETPLHARTVAASLSRFQADFLVSVPAHLMALGALSPGELPKLRGAFSSGAPLAAETSEGLEKRFGLRVTEVLGSTETGGIAMRQRPTEPWRPLPGVRVQVGEEGEMLLDSPFVAADAPRPFPCADRVALADGGGFHHLGRRDRVVKVASKRVDLDDVVERMLALPGVLDAAVLAEPTASARGNVILAAAVAPTWSPSALREALAARLDWVVVPRRIVCVPRLPREPTGKLQRDKLLSLFGGTPASDEGLPAAPASTRAFDPRSRPARPGVFDVHVPPELEFFGGHFPGDPILAGVVQLEMLVLRQVAATWPHLTNVARISRLRFRRPIRPGDDLELSLVLAAPVQVAFEISCRGHSCSAGTLHFREAVA